MEYIMKSFLDLVANPADKLSIQSSLVFWIDQYILDLTCLFSEIESLSSKKLP